MVTKDMPTTARPVLAALRQQHRITHSAGSKFRPIGPYLPESTFGACGVVTISDGLSCGSSRGPVWSHVALCGPLIESPATVL